MWLRTAEVQTQTASFLYAPCSAFLFLFCPSLLLSIQKIANVMKASVESSVIYPNGPVYRTGTRTTMEAAGSLGLLFCPPWESLPSQQQLLTSEVTRGYCLPVSKLFMSRSHGAILHPTYFAKHCVQDSLSFCVK